MELGAIMFGVLFVMLAIGVPISISLGISVMTVMLIHGNANVYSVIAQRMYASINSFPLMAIPFFVLAGNLMEYGGISSRLVNFIKMLVRKLPAAQATITTVASAFFGAISGSSPATTAAIGGIMIPSMTKTGYKPEEAGAIAASSGMLGVVVPPSIPMVTYAVTASVSVGTMFMAGFVPAILLCASMITIHMIYYRNHEKVSVEKLTFREIWSNFTEAIFALGMPLIILGGIYGGFFTPTEAASVACVYSFIVGMFVYKELKVSDLMLVLKKSAKGTAAIMFVIALASPFAWMMTYLGVPKAIASFMLSAFNSKFIIFSLINIFLLFLGCFMETQSIILLVTPILLPIAASFGVHPVSLGIIIVVNTAIGMMTPPMAANFFVANGITGQKSMGPISRKVVPYLISNLIVLFLITYVDEIILFLPKIMGMNL